MGIYSKSGQTGSSIPTFRFETLIEIQTLSQGGGAINYFRQTGTKTAAERRLFEFLVARGGIDQGRGYESLKSMRLSITQNIILSSFLTL
jgi:hypothetical protein